MKKIIFSFVLIIICATHPTVSVSANDGIDYYRDLMRKNEKKRFESYQDDDEIPTYESPFKNNNKDDEVKTLKVKKEKKSRQWDTWGRNGGQHKSSAEILRDMMSPSE